MLREVQSIPPAPRTVRWPVVLWHRWPLALLAFLLIVYCGAFTWMLWLQSTGGPQRQRDLDAGPVLTATGLVTSVDRALASHPTTGEPMDRVCYTFGLGDARIGGSCFAHYGACSPGAEVVVEYLPRTPSISRIQGTQLDLLPAWLQPELWFLVLVVPGVLVLASWFTGVLHLRHVMVHGDVGTARLLGARRLRFVAPAMLSVTFVFRDHHAQERQGRHWVRLHGPLGQRLQQQLAAGRDERLPVLHHRRWPRFSRLALPGDFQPGSPRGPQPSQEIAL